MPQEQSKLFKRIESGKKIVMAEINPPQSPDALSVRALAKKFAGKVHALGVGDNRDAVRLSAVAAASIILSEGVEPVLHMVTRDRNRAALVSDCLGAQALGIRNILCTSGTHQSLLPFHASKNVYDIDATVLLQTLNGLGKSAAIIGEKAVTGFDDAPLCLGAVASPGADPIELQLPRLAQKIYVGAKFIITQPVFDLERFARWWKEVAERGLPGKAAFIAGVKVFTGAESAKAFARKRPDPCVPEALLARLSSKTGAADCRGEGIKIALETIEKLSGFEGLRGFEISCDDDHDAAVETVDSLKSMIG